MQLEPRQLKHLSVIAECGSFSRAAAVMHVSQPALSNSIAQLEKILGGRVLDRGRNGARLTDLGSTLVRHARAVERQLWQAAEEVRLKKLGGSGPLAVAVTPVTAATLVPEALGRLTREAPHVAATIFEGIFSENLAALRAGEVDLMVGPIGVYPSSSEVIEEVLADDPFGLVMGSHHPLGRRRSICLRQLGDAEWTLPSEHSAFRRQLEALFLSAGVQWPAFYVATNSMTAIKAIVLHSRCVTIMPKRLIKLERKAGLLRCVELTDSGARRTLGVSWIRDRGLSPVAQRFVTFLREVASQHGRST